MKRISFNIEDEQHKQLKRIIVETGDTIKGLVIKGIAEYIEKNKHLINGNDHK